MKEKFVKWAKVTGIKVLKTMAETALSIITVDAVGIMDVDWLGLLSACALSGLATILFNIKSIEIEGE